MSNTAAGRLDFAVRHGVDMFIFIRECFQIAPLAVDNRDIYWDELVWVSVIFFAFNNQLPATRC